MQKLPRSVQLIFLFLAGWLTVHAAEPVGIEMDSLIMPVSAIMQAELDLIPTPQQALKQAINYRNNGQYGEARVTVIHGLYMAEPDSSIYQQLTDEIDFEQPVLQIKEWLIDGQANSAQQALDVLSDRYAADTARTTQIESLRGSIANARRLASMQKTDARTVVNAVRKLMRDYYHEHAMYPPSYRVLNSILPPGAAVLQNYEVILFRSALDKGYHLVLRNKNQHDNKLTITATGLIK